MKRSEGFTLIELLISIVVASIVLFAGATIILLGVNTNKIVSDSATMQNDSRVITQLMHNLTSRGTIDGIEKNNDNNTITLFEAVTIGDGDEAEIQQNPILIYYGDDNTISGGDSELPLVSNVENFSAQLLADGKILNLSLKVDGKTYSRSIYCRTRRFANAAEGGEAEEATEESGIVQSPEEIPMPTFDSTSLKELMEAITTTSGETEETDSGDAWQRQSFLQLLATQVGSTGTILGLGGEKLSYAHWYARYNHLANEADWADEDENEKIPWCACFLSWAARTAKNAGLITNDPPISANVEELKQQFEFGASIKAAEETPDPGDYIFLNNDEDTEADHVGVVLAVQDGIVFTIEGNSGGRVAIRAYTIDFDKILGYGVLDWAS